MDHAPLPIIIPVKNRPRLFQQTVDSLRATTTLPYRLILVLDHCDEQTTALARTLSGEVELIELQTDCGPGYCRNIGMERAGDAPFYYQSDADMYFLPNWLERLYAAMEAFPQLGIVGARRHPYHGVSERLELGDIRVALSDQQVGMSLFYRKAVWDQCGPFIHNPPTPEGIGKEDVEFCIKARALNGWQIGSLEPQAVLHCGIRNSLALETTGFREELKQPFPEGVIYE